MTRFSSLSDELKAELKICRTEEELKNVLTRENIELDPGMLEAISGGQCPIFRQEETNCRRFIREADRCPLVLRDVMYSGECPPYHIY